MTSMEAYSTVRTGTRRESAAAAADLGLALVLLRLPFRHTVRAARLARRAGWRSLDAARAEALVAAVRHTARLRPGRAACMETSLGAVLAAALLGRRRTDRLGPPPQPLAHQDHPRVRQHRARSISAAPTPETCPENDPRRARRTRGGLPPHRRQPSVRSTGRS